MYPLGRYARTPSLRGQRSATVMSDQPEKGLAILINYLQLHKIASIQELESEHFTVEVRQT